MRQGFTESVIEEAALTWPERLGWTVKHSPENDQESWQVHRLRAGSVGVTLRDTLLLELISGKLRVKEAERFIGRWA